MSVAVEVAVQDAPGARVALAAGADRVELCAGLAATGGLSPTPAAVAAVADVGLPVHVLVRPRAGGFVHDDDERRLLVAEVRDALAAGATGVVVGALTAGGAVDEPAVAALVAAADGAPVTFHRALDVVVDREDALERLVGLGVARVLTSGGAPRAGDGVDALSALVRAAAGRIEVMAGGGVVPRDVPRLLAAGVDAVHLSARGQAEDRGPVGPGGGAGGGRDVTDGSAVGAVVELARAYRRGGTAGGGWP
ncbi:copper homeostasis protein CutC [Actinotalea sp. JY-7876]|uniref:copper homeostasis protein CutC n=2 Tax=unclassified Actinotalea TaxID=2638618 RepID=UPI0015F5E24D|nr:copper homeostasis protein CutC [Actinotalea sp. JY-7876]